VRVAKREASEDWSLLVDTSASMGVGLPGKLQCAAEAAAALAATGLRAGVRVTLRTSGDLDRLTVRRGGAIGAVMRWLETKRASGRQGLDALLDPLQLRGAGRVFALGDLFDLEPSAVSRVQRRGRELSLIRILAPEELAPATNAVEWVDPESGEELRLSVDPRMLAAYELELSRDLERWRDFAARHRLAHGCWSSATAFEAIVERVLSPS
jgi:uncharacterized protein (DUF58 family)